LVYSPCFAYIKSTRLCFINFTDFQISSLGLQQTGKHNLSNSGEVQTLLRAW